VTLGAGDASLFLHGLRCLSPLLETAPFLLAPTSTLLASVFAGVLGTDKDNFSDLPLMLGRRLSKPRSLSEKQHGFNFQ
jgi:hypothetical protein